MILGHFELAEPIELREGEAATVVIENPVFYRRFIGNMLQQSAGNADGFSLSDERGELDFGKHACIITDVFDLSFNTKAISTRLLQSLGENSRLLSFDTERLITELNMFAAELASTSPVDVDFTELVTTDSLLKLFNFSVADESFAFCERIIEYIGLVERLLGKRLFVLLNLKSALTREEQAEFFKAVSYKKLLLLLVENRCSECCGKNEKIRIIDEDLCELS